jgi:hypothetical protein
MLADAIREIRSCIDQSEQNRRDRRIRMAPLRIAEDYEHELEELLLDDEGTLPAGLAGEIRRFVAGQCPALAGTHGDTLWTHTLQVLDLLFEVQELLQRRMGLTDLESEAA